MEPINPSSSYLSSSIPTMNIQPKAVNSKEYYYCPICNKVPTIILEDKYVHIKCCGTKEQMKIQQNEDVSNIQILQQFAQHKEYKLLLISYNQIIKQNAITPKNCESKFNHSEDKPAEEYCADCEEVNLMCKLCSTQHDKFLKNHKIKIKSNGLKISKLCQQSNCTSKAIIEYYCNQCNIHICKGCKLTLHKSHTTTSLNDLYSEIKNYIESQHSDSNLYTNQLKEYILKVQDVISKIDLLIKNQNKINNDILFFFQSLLNTYQSTKSIFNYHIFNNIKSNKLENIFLIFILF